MRISENKASFLRPESPTTVPAAIPTSAPPPIPQAWRAEIGEVLLTRTQIRSRVRELGAAISRDFKGRELTLVALLNGCVVFLADLIRQIPLPLRLDFIGVSTYRAGTAAGELILTKQLQIDVLGRDVLLVDDILDTGNTLENALASLKHLGAASVKICVLLDKPDRRKRPIRADYVGFTIPDAFVVGYGLDFAERFRNLPFIGILKTPHKHNP